MASFKTRELWIPEHKSRQPEMLRFHTLRNEKGSKLPHYTVATHGTMNGAQPGTTFDSFDSKLLQAEVRRNPSAVSNEIELKRNRDEDIVFATT